jgi:hypothetical protein
MAEFKVNRIIRITNRGHVLGGDIIAGEINAGDIIEVLMGDGNTISIKINSVEFIDWIKEQKFEIGLMLGILEENVKIHVEKLVGEKVSVTNGY